MRRKWCLLSFVVVCAALIAAGSTSMSPGVAVADTGGDAGAHSTWIQVGAHNPGLHGSLWRTDIGLRNVSDAAANVEVRFYPAGGGEMLSMTTQVVAGAQEVLEDAVGQIGGTGSGAIEVVSDQQLMITSRTYNQVAADADCNPGGTFGQYYAGYAVEEGLGEEESAWLAHLSESAQFRSNIAFTNMGDVEAVVRVELFDGAGMELNEFEFNLPPGRYRQEVQVFKNRAGQTAMQRGFARVSVISGAGVLVSASVVDNITNDPTTIPMVMNPVAGGSNAWLQVGAHNPGLHGSLWRTDLGLLNLGAEQATVEVRFYPADGGAMVNDTVQVAAGVQSVLQDVIGQLGAEGSGAVEIIPSQHVVVTSRTYNQIAADAACTPGGTFGQYYAGHTAAQGLGEDDAAWLAHLAESNRFRSNLAFTNMGDTDATVRVELFDGAGSPAEAMLESFELDLAPGQYRQEVRVFKNRAGQTDMDRGSARVSVLAGAGIIASASVVDNITNDPTTIPALMAPLGPVCTYAISPTNRTVGPEDGTGTVTVTAPNGCEWTAASNNPWIEITAGAEGSGDGVVEYAVEANPDEAERMGTLAIAGHTFTLTQSGEGCAFEIAPTSRNHGGGAETGTVEVTATEGCSWTAISNDGWIAVTAGASGSGDGTVEYSLNPNPGEEERTGTLAIAGHTFTVTQEALECTYDINPSGANYGPEGEVAYVDVTAPAGCPWVAVSSDPAWIIILDGESGSGNGVVWYAVEENLDLEARIGSLVIAGHTFTVTQEAAECSYGIAPESAGFDADGGSGAVTVTATGGCEWTAVSNVDWIAVTSGAAGTGDGVVEYTVDANPDIVERTGTVTIAKRTFTVTQAALECTYEILPTSANYPADGGTGSVAVTAPGPCAWAAASNVDWIAITSGEAGTGDGNVEYAVEANLVEQPRTGTLTIAGHTFTVDQEAAAPTATGIAGVVTDNGNPAAGVELRLFFDDGGGFDLAGPAIATTVVSGDGSYQFLDVTPLAAGQRYLVRFQQDAGANPQNDAWLGTWISFAITELEEGQLVPGGTFDIAAIANREPAAGSNRLLPVDFTWTPRPATPTDDYRFRILNNDTGDPDLFSDPLGYVGVYTISSLPAGFAYGQRYFWTLYVDGPDGGWGREQWLWSITFLDPSMDPPPPGITHSVAGNIVPGSVACPDGQTPPSTVQNQYLRAFTLSEFGIGGAFGVTRVHFGFESLAHDGGSAIPVTVNLYEMGASLNYADLTLIGTGEADFSGPLSQVLASVDVTGTAPAGSTLVVEVVTPDLSGVGRIWMGSNPFGQTGPTYLAAAGCGIDDPTDIAAIGFPDMMLVMSVEGTPESAREGVGAAGLPVIIGDVTPEVDFAQVFRPAKAGHELATQLNRVDGAHLIAPDLNRR